MAVTGLHPPAGRGDDYRRGNEVTHKEREKCVHARARMCAHVFVRVHTCVCVREKERDEGRMSSGYLIPRICNTQSRLYFCSVLV